MLHEVAGLLVDCLWKEKTIRFTLRKKMTKRKNNVIFILPVALISFLSISKQHGIMQFVSINQEKKNKNYLPPTVRDVDLETTEYPSLAVQT